jgi:signal transduction histidine kinase
MYFVLLLLGLKDDDNQGVIWRNMKIVKFFSSHKMKDGIQYLIRISILIFCLSNYSIQSLAQTLPDAEVDSLLRLTEQEKNDSIRGRAYNKLAFHYIFKDADRAKKLLNKALKEADEYNLVFGKSELLNTKATYFDIIGLKDSAELIFKKSLSISQQYQIRNVEVLTLNSLGLLYWKSGDFERALSKFFDVLLINDTYFPNDLDSRSDYLSNIGLIYQEMNRFEKAIDYHKQSLGIRKTLNLINGQAISFANLGVCYQKMEQFNLAEKYFLNAIKKAQEAENWWIYFALHDNLGNIYFLTERNNEAIDAYEKSLSKPKEISDNPKGNLSTYTNLATIYNQLNQPKTALQYLNKGLRILEDFPQLTAFSENLHLAMAESYYILGNNMQARESMQKYRNVLDSVFSQKNATALAQYEKKYESAKKDKELLENQKVIQQNEIDIKRRTIWFISAAAILLILSILLYALFKQKESLAKQTLIELELAEEKELAHLQNERLRISKELHDNIGSYLTLIRANLENVEEMNSEEIQDVLPQLQKTLSLSMRDLRKTVWLLNNSEITIDDLVIRLRDYFKPIEQIYTKIKVTVNGETEQKITDVQATHFFRIIQESLNNSLKYAKAKLVNIAIHVDEYIHFSISDDGMGFDVVQAKNGNGLSNIKSRINELNGEIQIESTIGKGTTIKGKFLWNEKSILEPKLSKNI